MTVFKTLVICKQLFFFFVNSALEKAESTLFVASGMHASVVMMQSLVPAGGHIITTTDCYRKTRMYIENQLPMMNISVIIFHLINVAHQICKSNGFSLLLSTGILVILLQKELRQPFFEGLIFYHDNILEFRAIDAFVLEAYILFIA